VTAAFIDAHRDEFGVEPICRVLQVAPSTYYAARSRPPSQRAVDDARLTGEIRRIHKQHYGVYGRRKIWRQLHREGIPVGRDRVARPMRAAGLCGAVRGRKVRTTRADASAARAPDLVDRDWTAAQRPNRLWVSDFTYVATCSGVVYVAFVIDVYSRFIVGWRAATSMRTELVLDALEMAVWRRDDRLDGLVCHSDAGSQPGFKGS
jgi:putative transposase